MPTPTDQRALRRRLLKLALTVGTAIAAGAVAWILAATPLFSLFELKTYDLRLVLRGREVPPPNIVIVTIDERAEQAIPEPRIFWHRHYAALLRAALAGGAQAIGMDVVFAIPVDKWEPDLDRELAGAFAEVSASIPVVLAYDTFQPAQEGIPLYLLANLNRAMGFANLTLDSDGFVRRQELTSRDSGAWESLAGRLAALLKDNKEGSDPHSVPLDHSGFMLIHYWGPSGTFPTISMADVLSIAKKGDQAQLERWFRGKTVLIGTTDVTDKRPTPFYLAGGQNLTAGVEIHASTLATLMTRRFLSEAPPIATPVLIFGAAVLAAFLIFRISFPLAPILLAAIGVVYLAVSVLFIQYSIVIPVIPPVLSGVLGGLASYGTYSLTEGRKRRLLQEVFGRYVSKEIALEAADYGEIPLGGAQSLLTIMFVDLRDFTTYCQGRAPQTVVAELNEYFADMTAEIKAQGGMVNKFIGDGIMALFGAPLPHPDDALRAVRAALQMVRRNKIFNQRRTENGLAPLIIGIGLHTGEAVVGNIGTPEKMEYTAIGDAVNVASRIEGENKTFHSQLLVSELTYRQVRENVVAELAGHAKLKGIAEPVALYQVFSEKGAKP